MRLSSSAGRSGALALGAALLVLALPPTSSGAAGNYAATADARLVGVDFTAVPAIAFDQLIDAGVSAAQAQIDSLGTTMAFASSPYPSNSVVLLPGLVAGVSGGQTSDLIPQYPLIASTDETNAADHRELGTIVLDAASVLGSSRGTVTDGATSATATTTAEEARVVARAETTISSIQLTPALSLDGVRTTAEAVQTPGGELELASSFEVAALTVLGQRIALDADSLSALGSEVPLGIDLTGVLGQLLVGLAADGTRIEFVPAIATDDGITSAGLRITTVLPAPPEIASGVQELRAQVTLGLASASVSNRATGRLGTVAPDLPSTPSAGTVTRPGLGTGGAPAGGSVLAPTGGGISSDPTASPAAAPEVAARPASTSRPLPVDLSLVGFYPVLVLAAAIGVVLVNLIRHLGVRSP